jgi:D-serine deaminase-like pyridoxal phosphate-dependent protein
MRRVGMPTLDAAVALARLVAETEGLVFDGLAFYPGHVREPITDQDASLRELDVELTRALERFHDADLPPRVVSGGSTPTLWRTHEMPCVTEIRAGTYVFNDRMTVHTGTSAWEDCALSVLATVVSTSVAGQAVIDAGSKSLGREPAPDARDGSFGQLVEHPEVTVARMSEEHGVLDLSRTPWRPTVGEVVRVVPNHVCIVVHLHDLIYGYRGERIESSWPVTARGRGAESV